MINITRPKKKIFEYYSTVATKKVEWLWFPYIPYGKITIIQGDPGDGKSTFMLNVAAIVTNGGILPNSKIKLLPQNVIYQCNEDDVSDTIKPRLISAGANCDRIAYIIDKNTELTLLDDRIEKTIKLTNAKLVILDPLQSFLHDTDMSCAIKMRSILKKLSQIATKYQCAIVLIGHMNKSNYGKNIYRGLGSIDINAIARSILMVYRDEEDLNIRYVLQIKSNLAPEGNIIGFEFTKTGFSWLDSSKIENRKIIQIIKENNKRENCISYLEKLLSNGEIQSSEVIQEIKNKNISERTLYTVKKELGILSYKLNGIWYWKLPLNYVVAEDNENA